MSNAPSGTDLDRLNAGQLALSLPNYRDLVKRPLLALPVSLRPDALRLWTCHRHLVGLESPLAIAGAIAVWIGSHGLTEEDASDVMQNLTSPEKMGAHKFASDLMTSLASEVAERIRRKRARDEQARRRREDQEAEKNAASPEVIRSMILNGIGMSV